MIEVYYNWLIKQKALTLISFIATTIGIVILTLMPPENLGASKLFQYDKLGHFFIFFMAGSFFGISIEILQHLTPFGRSANFIDAAADIAGSLAAVLLLKYLQYQTKG